MIILDIVRHFVRPSYNPRPVHMGFVVVTVTGFSAKTLVFPVNTLSSGIHPSTTLHNLKVTHLKNHLRSFKT